MVPERQEHAMPEPAPAQARHHEGIDAVSGQHLTHEEMAAFARKLESWSRTLLPKEQVFLDELLVYAASPETGGVSRRR